MLRLLGFVMIGVSLAMLRWAYVQHKWERARKRLLARKWSCLA